MIGDCDTVDSRERCICVPERQVHDYAIFLLVPWILDQHHPTIPIAHMLRMNYRT